MSFFQPYKIPCAHRMWILARLQYSANLREPNPFSFTRHTPTFGELPRARSKSRPTTCRSVYIIRRNSLVVRTRGVERNLFVVSPKTKTTRQFTCFDKRVMVYITRITDLTIRSRGNMHHQQKRRLFLDVAESPYAERVPSGYSG